MQSLCLHRQHLSRKLRHLIAVHFNRRDLRFLHFRSIHLIALFLIDAGIRIREIFIRNAYHIFFRYLRQTIDLVHDILVRDTPDKRLQELIGAGTIGLQLLHLRATHVIDDGCQQVFREIAGFQFLHLRQQKITGLLQCLSLFGNTDHQVGREVIAYIGERTDAQYLLTLLQFVQQTALAVLQDLSDDGYDIHFRRLSVRETPT